MKSKATVDAKTSHGLDGGTLAAREARIWRALYDSVEVEPRVWVSALVAIVIA